MSWQQKHPSTTIILLVYIPARRVNPTLSRKTAWWQDVSLPTCPLSKFSFSSSRLLAPPVRRITLGIALGTCCMELLTRSIFVCFSQPRNENNEKNKNVQSNGLYKKSKQIGSNYGGQRSMLCWTRRPLHYFIWPFRPPPQSMTGAVWTAPSKFTHS